MPASRRRTQSQWTVVPARPAPRPQGGSWLPGLLFCGKLALVVAPVVLYAIGYAPDDTPSAVVLAARAEQQLMGRVATAGPEIERRLRQWLEPREGMLYVRGSTYDLDPDGLHVLPPDPSWRASCGELGLAVTVGGFRKELTELALDQRQCQQLLGIVGVAMLRVTKP